MQERQSSNLKPHSRFSGIHMLATSFAAVAGVAIAAYQTLHHSPDVAPPAVQVTVAVDPPKALASSTDVSKGDSSSVPGQDLAQGAALSAALNDGIEQRYSFADMFDGNAQTKLSIKEPDSEINVLLTFAGGQAQVVRNIEYLPPAAGGTSATQLDVMVLPEGQMSGAGRAIQSFELQTTPGKQSFEIPGVETGKAIWFRIAGPAGQGAISVGEFRVLK